MVRKWVCLAVALLLLCTGCVDVESYLQPPRAQGQQQAVQDALETALEAEGNGASYILKYPVASDISSAFLLLDANGEQTSADDAVTAVAFYAPTPSARAHIRLLHRENDTWSTVKDFEGEANELNQVKLGDLDGDGKQELLVGWHLYSSDYQLSVYALSDRLLETADVGRYAAYFVGDISEHPGDELVLLHKGDTVSATLYKWSPDSPKTLGKVQLRADIRSFEKMLGGKISTGENGLYVDTLLENGKYATALLYWDGERLQAPLHRTGANVSRLAERLTGVYTKDVDNNGVPEIPVMLPLANAHNESMQSWQWLTEWYTWDVTAGEALKQSAGIVNAADGYYIELEQTWLDTVSVRYEEAACTLWLEDENNQPFLAIQHTDASMQSVSGYMFEEVPGDLPLRIWYTENEPYRLTLEKVSYMLMAL